VSPVSRDLRSTDCRLSKTCSVLLNIRVNDDNALFSLEKWTLETWAQHLARVDDNVVYTIFKYMNVDNRIGSRGDFPLGRRASHHHGGSSKRNELAVLRLCRYR